jgi:hypothetical protein
MAVMSGSLIQESKTNANVTLADIEKKMTDLCENEFSRTALGFAVRDIEEYHQAKFGGHAKFWILLAVCAILAYPKFYRNKIAFYLAIAEDCLDADANLHQEFYTTLQAEVQRRNAADDKISLGTRILYSSVDRHASVMLSKLQ